MAKGQQPIIIKKKKVSGHGHHGGSWKVAYADFVTAMMAFFMVMWIMGMSSNDKELIAGYFNDPLGFTKNQPKMKITIQPALGKNGQPAKLKLNYSNSENATTKAAATSLAKQIKNEIKGDKNPEVQKLTQYVTMKVTEEGLEIEFSENSGVVFFEVGSSEIRPAAMELIKRISPLLGTSHRVMEIKGHTDARPMPNSSYTNVELSTDRARAVMHAFLATGVHEKQVLAVSGLGDSQLKDKSDPNSYVNRRVTVLLPFTKGADEKASLPKDVMDAQTEAVFRKPSDFVRPIRIHP